MNKIFQTLFFIILVFNTALNATTPTVNLNDTIDTAVKGNKQVLVFFHMDNCGYCTRMNSRTLDNQDVRNKINKSFVLVDININHKGNIVSNDQSYSYQEFASSVAVDFYPTILFYDENYDVTYMVRGYRDSEKFQEILEFIDTKSYEFMSFFDYESLSKTK